MMCHVNWIKTKVRDFPIFNGIDTLDMFLNKIDVTIREEHKIPLLDVALPVTPT